MSSRHESYGGGYDEPSTSGRYSGHSRSTRHDAYDDEEEPFTPRQTSRRHNDDDDEEGEQAFTLRRRSRRDDEDEDEEEEQPFNLQRYRSRYGEEAAREIVREDELREEYDRNGWD